MRCTSLLSFEATSSLRYIASNAFRDCGSMIHYDWTGATHLIGIGPRAFDVAFHFMHNSEVGGNTLQFAGELMFIGSRAFSNQNLDSGEESRYTLILGQPNNKLHMTFDESHMQQLNNWQKNALGSNIVQALYVTQLVYEKRASGTSDGSKAQLKSVIVYTTTMGSDPDAMAYSYDGSVVSYREIFASIQAGYEAFTTFQFA